MTIFVEKICVMRNKEALQLFGEKKIRTAWNQEEEKWYFSIVDVCEVLTDSKDYLTARKYWNKLKQRLNEEGNETVTNCHQLKLRAADGKMRLTDVADQQQLFRGYDNRYTATTHCKDAGQYWRESKAYQTLRCVV